MPIPVWSPVSWSLLWHICFLSRMDIFFHLLCYTLRRIRTKRRCSPSAQQRPISVSRSHGVIMMCKLWRLRDETSPKSPRYSPFWATERWKRQVERLKYVLQRSGSHSRTDISNQISRVLDNLWLVDFVTRPETRSRALKESKEEVTNQNLLWITVLIRWGSRTRYRSLFCRWTIPVFSSDAAQATMLHYECYYCIIKSTSGNQ